MSHWDRRFLDLATMVASWSKDPSTKVGAVIVRPDKHIASVGFNGFPAGMSDDPALYADREFKYAHVIHAEKNAIDHAGGPVAGCTIYTTFLPCDVCARLVRDAGIVRVVSLETDSERAIRWKEAFDLSRSIFFDANVTVDVLSQQFG